MRYNFEILTPETFERFANDLLYCDIARFVPNPTPHGVTDGGNDGFYEGPWPPNGGGEPTRWKVSAKMIKLGTSRRAEIRRLESNLADDAKRAEGRPILVVTNLDIQEPERGAFLTWLQERAPGSALVPRSYLTTLLDSHPYVARTWRVGGSETAAAFMLAGDATLDSHARPPPTNPFGLFDQILRLLADGAVSIDVVGPPGFGQAQLADALAHRLRFGPAIPSRVARMVPLLVVARDVAELRGALTGEGIRSGQQGYLFIIPPGRENNAAEELAACLRTGDPGLERAVSVAFVTEEQHNRLRSRCGARPSRRVDLHAVEPDRIHAWLADCATAGGHRWRPDHLLSLAHGCAGRPGDARAILEFGGEGLATTWYPWRQVWHDGAGVGTDSAEADFAFLLLLTAPPGGVPPRAGEPTDEEGGAPGGAIPELQSLALALGPGIELDVLARQTSVEPGRAKQVARRMEGSPGVLHWTDEAGHVLSTEPGAAAITRLILNGDRSSSRVAALFGAVKSLPAPIRTRACERLWFWHESEEPACAYVREIAREAREARGHSLVHRVGSIFPLARLGPAAARECTAMARETLDRMCVEPDVGVDSAGTLAFVSLGRHELARKLLELFVACVRGAADVGGAFDAALTLAELPDGADASDLERLGAALSEPMRGDDAVDGLLDNLEVASGATEVAAIARGAAHKILSSGVDWSGSFGTTLGWGAVPWRESEAVQRRRDRLVGIALRWIEANRGDSPFAGWDILDLLWRAPSGPMPVPSLPPGVILLLEKCVRAAAAALAVPDAWTLWTRAEWFVLHVMWFPNPPHRAIADVVRAFPADPLYLAWRLLACPDDVVPDPATLARRIAEGARWGEVADTTAGDDAQHAALAEAVALRLAASRHAPAEVTALLERVHAHLTESGPGGTHAVLTAWMRVDVELFRRILFGTEWAQVPPSMRRIVLEAACPVFADQLRACLGERASSSGELTGCLPLLATVLHHPTTASRLDIDGGLSTLLALLAPDGMLALLARVAGHGEEAVRVVTADALAWTLRRHVAALEMEQVVSCARRIAAGEPGAAGLRALLRAFRPGAVAPALAVAIGEELLERLPDRSGDLGALSRRADGFVAAAVLHAADTWLNAVWRCAVDPAGAAVIDLLAPPLPSERAIELVGILAREAGARGEWGRAARPQFWGWLFERMARSIFDEFERRSAAETMRQNGSPPL